jgi:hypothetical protein
MRVGRFIFTSGNPDYEDLSRRSQRCLELLVLSRGEAAFPCGVRFIIHFRELCEVEAALRDGWRPAAACWLPHRRRLKPACPREPIDGAEPSLA